jgi:hypothetical protein
MSTMDPPTSDVTILGLKILLNCPKDIQEMANTYSRKFKY